MGDFIFRIKPSFKLGFKPNFGLKPDLAFRLSFGLKL